MPRRANLLLSVRSVLSVPSVVKSSAPRLDLLYPLINDPDLINDPVAQPFLAVRRAHTSKNAQQSPHSRL
jgi:hypothetical protein